MSLQKVLQLCLLMWSSSALLAHAETICVSSDDIDSETSVCTCWVNNLTEIIQDGLIKSDTTIILSNGTLILDSRLAFSNVSSVTIKTDKPSSKAIIICLGQGILVFQNASSIEISDLIIINCSKTQEVIPVIVYNMMVTVMPALLFLFGRDLVLKNITIIHSGSGLCLVDVAGRVDIAAIRISNQANMTKKTRNFAGNLILYTSSTQTETVLNMSELTISRCGYIKDDSHVKTVYMLPSGLTLFLNSTEVSVTITDSVFYMNKGRLGGNLLLLLYYLKGNGNQSAVILHNVTFEQGTAVYGGGLYISLERSFYQQPNILKNDSAFLIHRCTFRNNSAIYGGGGLYLQWAKSLVYRKIYHSKIVECTFIGNRLNHDGAGLALQFKIYINSPREYDNQIKFHVDVHVCRCNFSSHSNRKSQKSESGVIFANSAALVLDTLYIANNSVTGILLIDCKITFSGSSVLTNNSAVNGGGMKLCSNSLMLFTKNTKLLLTNNNAETIGGGIMVGSKCLAEQPMCFYQFITDEEYEDPDLLRTINTINITLHNNSAGLAGHNIFGGSIDYCYFFFLRNQSKKNVSVLHVPPNTMSNPTSVSSNPQHVCLMDSQTYSCAKKGNISIFPGERVSFNVRVMGQCDGSVPGIVHASTDENVLVLSEQDVNVTNSSGKAIEFVIASTNKTSPGYLKLNVGSGNSYVIFTEYTRIPPVNISVNFKTCPEGFFLIPNWEGYICDCKKAFHGIDRCQLASNSASIIKKGNMWIGVLQTSGQSLFLSAECPLDYCSYNVTNVSIATPPSQDAQCKHNRTGVMCGACLKGWSVMLGTSKCSSSCSDLTILLLIPFLLAGLFLLLAVSFLNITVTAGTINGIIFYANVLHAYQVELLVKHPVAILSMILKVFLSWLNLDLGIPVCFFKGMDAFSKTLLQGVFPMYLWLIGIVVIKLSNRYVSVTRLIGKNPVQVLATIFLLSYSKMLRVALSTLKYTRLHVYNETSGLSHVQLKWFLDGRQSYFTSSCHLTLSMVAIVFVTLTLPFMASLLCIRHIFSLSNYCKCFSFINKLKPFFDAYSGPFKDNARFWPGLLLLVRLVLLLVNVVPSTYSYYIINITVLFLLALMVYLNGVYKSRILNIIEHSFLLNLAIVFASLSAKNIHTSWNRLVVHASFLVAVVTFIGIVGYHVKVRLSAIRWARAPVTQRLNASQTFDVLSTERHRQNEEGRSPDDFSSEVDKLVDFST